MGWGGNVYGTKIEIKTKYLDNDPKDFIPLAKKQMEDEIRKELAQYGGQ